VREGKGSKRRQDKRKKNKSKGRGGVTLENEMFTDLDFADDVSKLAEMSEVIVLALTVMQEKAPPTVGRRPKSYRFPFPPLAQQSRWQMDMLKWSMHLSIWEA